MTLDPQLRRPHAIGEPWAEFDAIVGRWPVVVHVKTIPGS